MADPLQLRIPTATLMEMVQKHPEMKVEFEKIAFEKVAEEIVRKMRGGALRDFEEKVQEATAALLKRLPGASYKVTLSQQAKQMVEDELRILIRQLVADQAEAIKDMAVADLEKMCLTSVQALIDKEKQAREDFWSKMENWWNDQRKDLEASVKATARTEFFAVLQEAKSLGA